MVVLSVLYWILLEIVWYPLVMTNTSLLKMAHLVRWCTHSRWWIFPVRELQTFTLEAKPEAKPPLSQVVFLWFSHCPMGLPLFSYGFPIVPWLFPWSTPAKRGSHRFRPEPRSARWSPRPRPEGRYLRIRRLGCCRSPGRWMSFSVFPMTDPCMVLVD